MAADALFAFSSEDPRSSGWWTRVLQGMRAGPPPVEIDEILALVLSENENISRPGLATIQIWREFGARLTLRELLTINFHRGPYSDGYIAPEIQDVLLLVFGSLRVRAEVDSGAATFRNPLPRRRGTSRPNEGSDRLNRRRRTESEENGVERERRRLVAPRTPSAPPLQPELSATVPVAHTAQPLVQSAAQENRSRDGSSECRASSSGRPSVAEQALLPAAAATEQTAGRTADHQPDRPAESARGADPDSLRAAQPAERRSEPLTERFAVERSEQSARQPAERAAEQLAAPERPPGFPRRRALALRTPAAPPSPNHRERSPRWPVSQPRGLQFPTQQNVGQLLLDFAPKKPKV